MQRFRGGFVFKAHRLVYHSTLAALQAIAYATLRTLVEDIKCFSLFVTHYQLICQVLLLFFFFTLKPRVE